MRKFLRCLRPNTTDSSEEEDDCVQIRVDEGWCDLQKSCESVYLAIRVGKEVHHTSTCPSKKGAVTWNEEVLTFKDVETPASGVPTDILWCDADTDEVLAATRFFLPSKPTGTAVQLWSNGKHVGFLSIVLDPLGEEYYDIENVENAFT
jgi:hypothetical protein